MRFLMSLTSILKPIGGVAVVGVEGRVARPEPTAGVSPERPRRMSKRSFYAGSLTEAEQVALAQAADVENLDEEIAVLRVRLKTALSEHPQDYALLVRGIGMLTRAVAAQYRLSPRASKDLADRFASVLNSVGDQLFPEGR
jgi:hypothetical protein